ASALKVMRLLIGVDDSADDLKLIPRLPDGWSAIHVKSVPAQTRRGTVHLELHFQRRADGSFHHLIVADQSTPRLAVRVGPFDEKLAGKHVDITVNGIDRKLLLEKSGTCTWAWLTNLSEAKRWEIVSQPPPG